jgi:hypothetical protein
VIWSQRLRLEYIDRGPGYPVRLQRFDQGHLVDERTTRCVLTNLAVGFIGVNSGAPISPLVRLLSTRWTVTMSASRNSVCLSTRVAPAALASRSGRRYQLEVRELLQDLPRKRRAFAHDAYRVERPQALDHSRGIGDVIVEHSDLGVPPDDRPVGKPQRNVLVVVEDRNLHWTPSFCLPAKNPARAPATALGSFSIGMCPADLIRTSLVSGISRA